MSKSSHIESRSQFFRDLQSEDVSEPPSESSAPVLRPYNCKPLVAPKPSTGAQVPLLIPESCAPILCPKPTCTTDLKSDSNIEDKDESANVVHMISRSVLRRSGAFHGKSGRQRNNNTDRLGIITPIDFSDISIGEGGNEDVHSNVVKEVISRTSSSSSNRHSNRSDISMRTDEEPTLGSLHTSSVSSSTSSLNSESDNDHMAGDDGDIFDGWPSDEFSDYENHQEMGDEVSCMSSIPFP